MTVLILAEQCDEGAAATARAAAARVGTGRVLVVHPVELALASWTHRISPSGAADTTVRLRDGRRFDSDGVSAVLVRMDLAPLPRFAGARPADRDYAASEFLALLVSWLHGLGRRVVNRVDGIGLTGPSWSPRRWLVEAARAGLPVRGFTVATSARLVPGWVGSPYDARLPFEREPYPAADSRRALVAGSAAIGCDPSQRGACLRLAAASGCRLLEIELTEALEVSAVSAVPPLRSVEECELAGDLLARIALSEAA